MSKNPVLEIFTGFQVIFIVYLHYPCGYPEIHFFSQIIADHIRVTWISMNSLRHPYILPGTLYLEWCGCRSSAEKGACWKYSL